MHTPPPNMGFPLLIFLLLVTVTITVASPNSYNHLLMPHSNKQSEVNCLSWRLAVETNNHQNWEVVPEECAEYIRLYMLEWPIQYFADCDQVVADAYEYAKGLNVTGHDKDVWIFDIDDTALSNLGYYMDDTVRFGPPNSTAFNAWVEQAKVPQLYPSLQLYRKLLKLGFKIVFLSETDEVYRKARYNNLKEVGYTTWEKLILRYYFEGTGAVFKSKKRKELEGAGYKIRGNIGDQWSDLLGTNVGDRAFKLPNPMYYVG